MVDLSIIVNFTARVAKNRRERDKTHIGKKFHTRGNA